MSASVVSGSFRKRRPQPVSGSSSTTPSGSIRRWAIGPSASFAHIRGYWRLEERGALQGGPKHEGERRHLCRFQQRESRCAKNLQKGLQDAGSVRIVTGQRQYREMDFGKVANAMRRSVLVDDSNVAENRPRCRTGLMVVRPRIG